MPFTFKRLNIPEIILVEAKSFLDDRGFFLETFKESAFNENGIDTRFVQDNFSHSIKGVLRGFHYQKNPKAQAKLVTALRGEIFDVAVDIRKGSSTYGKTGKTAKELLLKYEIGKLIEAKLTNSRVSNLSLTSVGRVIGLLYFERILGQEIDIGIWTILY